MRRAAILSVCTLGLIAACMGSSGPRKLGGTTQANSICEPNHFQDFLDQFSEDVQVQRKHTAFPLRRRENRHVTTQLDSVPVELNLKEPEVRFPVYPNPTQLHDQSLTVEVSAENGDKKQVRVSRADTGYLVVYSFEHDRCWRLTRVEDMSP